MGYIYKGLQSDSICRFVSFLQSTAAPLVDLSLYVSSENYNSTTSSAYTAILPWNLNYTIPPRRRDLARSRTAHLGLSSLDINTAEQGGKKPGVGGARSDFEAAKRDAGISTQPKAFSLGRKSGIQGLLGSPVYAARFKLDALSNELLEPLSELLGRKKYLFDGDGPSTLDCVAFGYLALMFYPVLPQAWLKEDMKARFPRLVDYVERMRKELVGDEDVRPADVWEISCSKDDQNTQLLLLKLGLQLPWRPIPRRPFAGTVTTATREIVSNIPLLSTIFQSRTIIQDDAAPVTRKAPSSLPSATSVNAVYAMTATILAAFAALAIKHRRSPREGDLIFWALRPQAAGLGEAGTILSALAGMPLI